MIGNARPECLGSAFIRATCRRDDLLCRNFSKVCMTWDCH